MVNEDFSTKQSSFLLSKKQREDLIGPGKNTQAAIEKRNKLPELITRLIEDIILYESEMLLPPDPEERIWNDLSDRLPDEEDYLGEYGARSTSYEMGSTMGAALNLLVPDGQVYKRSLVCGLLDGSLGGFEFANETGIENLNEIRRSADHIFERYRKEITMASYSFSESSEALPDGIFNELDDQGIEVTGGISEMVLRRSGSDSLNTCSALIDSILDETSLEEFDRLADRLRNDTHDLENLEYNNTPVLDILEVLRKKEKVQNQSLRAVEIASDLKGVDKNTVGRLLLRISNTPNSQAPWTQRPLVQVRRTNTSRQYRLTQYGRLFLTSLFEYDGEHREWLHRIASHEDKKSSNYSPKFDFPMPDFYPVEEQISIAKEALKEIE